jgi:hypothetical protein
MVPLALVCALLFSGVAAQAPAAQAPAPVAAAASFDKTKFVFDVGTAAYAIHHFIYAPYKAGKLHGFSADAKAALAAAFAINRLHAAYSIANSGNSRLLHAIVSPFNSLIGLLGSLKSQITHGKTTQVNPANSALSALSSAAKGAGVPFSDVTTSV